MFFHEGEHAGSPLQILMFMRANTQVRPYKYRTGQKRKGSPIIFGLVGVALIRKIPQFFVGANLRVRPFKSFHNFS